MSPRHVLVVLVGLAACGPEDEIQKEDFPHWAAVVSCERTAECMRGNYESAYYGMDDCVATLERSFEQMVENMDDRDCDYSARAAGTAVSEIDEMSCERFYEGDANESTADVWDDCAFYGYP